MLASTQQPGGLPGCWYIPVDNTGCILTEVDNQGYLHPGASTSELPLSVLRFQAPVEGNFSIEAEFRNTHPPGVSFSGIIVNGTVVKVLGAHGPKYGPAWHVLNQFEIVYFIVSAGPSGDFGSDTTMANITIVV